MQFLTHNLMTPVSYTHLDVYKRQGLNDVREAVREARRKGVIVIPIMFGRASDREQMKDNFSYMYGQFISCDPIDITDEFTKLFTKLIQTA